MQPKAVGYEMNWDSCTERLHQQRVLPTSTHEIKKGIMRLVLGINPLISLDVANRMENLWLPGRKDRLRIC